MAFRPGTVAREDSLGVIGYSLARWHMSLAAAGAVLLVASSLVLAGTSEPTAFDSRMMASWTDPSASVFRIAQVVDQVGEPPGLVIALAAMVGVCLALRRPWLAVVTLVGVGASAVSTTILKPIIDRTIHGEFLSFPSGHAAIATAFAIVIALLIADLASLGPATYLLIAIGAALVAASVEGWAQVAMGSHYPTDAVGGFACALVIVPLTAWLVDRVAPRIMRSGEKVA